MFTVAWSVGNNQVQMLIIFILLSLLNWTEKGRKHGIIGVMSYLKNKNINSMSYNQVRRYSSLRSSLAGLIEGDGYIGVHDKNYKSKQYRPKIIIAFNIKDKLLAEKLSAELKVGKVISKPKLGHVLLQIIAKEEVLKIINLINRYMRTSKIEALHRAIYIE